jgi:hypothetical protein
MFVGEGRELCRDQGDRNKKNQGRENKEKNQRTSKERCLRKAPDIIDRADDEQRER